MTTTRQEVTIEPGMTVQAKPIGQTRRQTIYVTRVEEEYAIGYLCSKKYPGNYRGTAVAYVTDCAPVNPTRQEA